MNDILQQIMNMIENTRTVPSISSFSMIGFTVLLIFGVINCILGYRLLRFWMMLCGFVIGAGIGFGAAYTGGEIYVCGFYGWSGCTTGRDRICEL